jgi:hypothetical protein
MHLNYLHHKFPLVPSVIIVIINNNILVIAGIAIVLKGSVIRNMPVIV